MFWVDAWGFGFAGVHKCITFMAGTAGHVPRLAFGVGDVFHQGEFGVALDSSSNDT